MIVFALPGLSLNTRSPSTTASVSSPVPSREKMNDASNCCAYYDVIDHAFEYYLNHTSEDFTGAHVGTFS